MLRSLPTHPDTAAEHSSPHPGSVWIDLFDASEADVRLVEQLTGLEIPSRADLDEIETSSRQYRKNGAVYISVPVARPDAEGAPRTSPLGFVLTADRLISIRFADLPSFDAVAAGWGKPDYPHGSSAAVLATLLTGVVERIADVMEHASGELDAISHDIFHTVDEKARSRRHIDATLRGTLRKVGQVGDITSRLRDVLLAISRAVPFVLSSAPDWIVREDRSQFETIQQDARSLAEYEAHLSGKVQFLLDATLGFINIEQNNIMKVLTVASVVGIPPVLIAGVYGMNFKGIPEYDWPYGYAYSLVLMLVTAGLTLAWFRRRGWL